jgi:hypothetical protein
MIAASLYRIGIHGKISKNHVRNVGKDIFMLQSKWQQLLKLEAAGEGAAGGTQDSGSQGAPKGEAKPPVSADAGKDEQLDVEKLPANVQALIKSLREENAKHRTKNKELGEGQTKLKAALVEAGIIENDEVEPEEKIKGLSADLQGAQMRAALLEAAVEHEVPKSQLKYFQFLIAERLEALEDDGELSQDDIAEIALEAKKVLGAGGTGSKGASSSAGTGSAPQAGGDGRITQEQFDAMGIMEKSALYSKNPELYNQLFAASKLNKRR